MSDYVLFKMWGPFRQSLINGHLFYVEQAHKRLLSQFDDIESEAERAIEEWLERSNHNSDPDRYDPEDIYEAANEIGIEFYGLLSDMRDQTRLSVVAGMFHEWDKQLRDWLVREIRHWHHGDNAVSRIWSADFGQIADFMECLGWGIRSSHYFRALDGCRLVVNVYKHGDGKSLIDLKRDYPEYLDDPFQGTAGAISAIEYCNYTHLKVSDEQFQAFSDAIVAFWRGVPENVWSSQTSAVPGWLEKAFLNDHAKRKQAS